MKIDIIIGGLFLLVHLLMIPNMDGEMTNWIYNALTELMAFTGWFFVGRFLYINFKKSL